MPIDQISLNYYDESLGIIKVIASATKSYGWLSDVQVPVPEALREKFLDPEYFPKMILLNSIEKDSLADAYLKALGRGPSSLMNMRMHIEGNLMGGVTVMAAGQNCFAQEHLELLSILEAPFSIAISNSRQYHQLLLLNERLSSDNLQLKDEVRLLAGGDIIGAESGLKEVIRLVSQVAPTTTPVLLLGETGVGKELIARRLHDLSFRSNGPYVTVNCGAIPASLMDSELFGHEKGAFTGAVILRKGCFERAHKGTIFLDEIGDLSLEVQTRMLRVLQQMEFVRVGGTEPVRVDIRVIAATNRPLQKLVQDGQFREDLYYRIKVFPMIIPSLRERKVDIPELARYFLNRHALRLRLAATPPLAPQTLGHLLAYNWPGNVRELEHILERAIIINPKGPINIDDLSPLLPIQSRVVPSPIPDSRFQKMDEVVAAHVRAALTLANGRVEGRGGAAELLNLPPGTLRYRMRKLGIKFGRQANNHINQPGESLEKSP